MNRREFLEAASLSAAIPRKIWAANDKVNVAILGAGGRGSSHVADFVRRQDANLAAVCDVDTARTERAVQTYYSARNVKPKIYSDLRKLYADHDVDAVIVATPNHWHALATIWACQAGKDVYVEKPASYNPFEGERMVAAARHYDRVVQGGMQRRSLAHKKRAVELLRQGVIGDIYMARGLCYKRRKSIGHKPDGPVPPGVDWDLFLGPAPMRPYNENRRVYNWHWFWDTGNGDIGNQGIHELDYARWAINKPGNPKTVYSGGGKYVYNDDQETPNTQTVVYDYGNLELTFEVRGLLTGGESEMALRGGNFIGNLFYGAKGYMVVEDRGFQIFLGEKREPGESMKMVEGKDDENTAHVSNFLQAVRSRRWQDLVAEVKEAAISADLVHMANISYRTGRKLTLEAGPTRFVNDEEANKLLDQAAVQSAVYRKLRVRIDAGDMAHLRWLDLSIVCAYLLALTATGLWFSRKQTTTEQYFMAKRSIPAWAMGMSVVTTLITSITFVSYPGSAYSKDWSLLVPGFMVVAVLALVGAVIIPFYRQTVGMSAYEYFGKRFGVPTRVYSSIAFALGHFSKMGFVFYLLALTINSITGWNMDEVIVIAGVLTIVYTLKGGLEAVVWTDVIQGFVLLAGIFVCLGYLLFLPPGGPAAVVELASANHRFRLGDWTANFSKPTIPVLLIYGFFWYLQKYTADQTLVQRYLIAKSDRAALRGVSIGALLCVPIWSLFMLIGTCTWAFYQITKEKLPLYIAKADQVFPYFLSTHIPPGMAGLILASVLGSAMCALASDLNSLAVVGVEDIYRLIRPQTPDRDRLRMAKYLVAGCGIGCIVTALGLAHTKGSALSMWFTVSAVASGGLAGLFLLAFLSARASRRGVYVGIVASVLFIIWSSLTLNEKRVVDLGVFNFPWHDYMIGAIAHVVLLVVGYGASILLPDKGNDPELGDMTIWRWLKSRKQEAAPMPVATRMP